MDIFISYRRGGIDQPNAGRISDHLTGLGYQVYYDKNEQVNKVGAQFPGAIRQALQSSRILIAVIGESWIEQAHRLADERDWVRRELLHARSGVTIIPIYLGRRVDDLPELPVDLEFVRTAHAFLWDEFETDQKKALERRLVELLPGARPRSQAGDLSRLDLLCDRVPAEKGFEEVVQSLEEDSLQEPGYWLLFGEKDQGHSAMFERLDAHTLARADYQERYPVKPPLIQVVLEGCYRRPRAEIQEQVLAAVTSKLGGRAKSYQEMYPLLRRCRSQLCVLYAIVPVKSRAEARWWISCFQQIQEDIPLRAGDDPRIVLACSIAYPRRSLRSFLTHRLLTGFFRQTYPSEFDSAAAVQRPGRGWTSSSVRRLTPIRREHIYNWCNHREVRAHVSWIDESLFRKHFKWWRRELPMDRVSQIIRGVLNGHPRQATGEYR